ncbi:uncharacterized protein MONOS_17123 [Monocercomonoides exilis]|uniref:uncharacterized protein n=1 Tax=Monocercomonoides exilis TaxID=2049356 RepID=UPI00355A8775|nr:hypothetical protein MONOS_17123 [Monocercomonoides exilis]
MGRDGGKEGGRWVERIDNVFIGGNDKSWMRNGDIWGEDGFIKYTERGGTCGRLREVAPGVCSARDGGGGGGRWEEGTLTLTLCIDEVEADVLRGWSEMRG